MTETTIRTKCATCGQTLRESAVKGFQGRLYCSQKCSVLDQNGEGASTLAAAFADVAAVLAMDDDAPATPDAIAARVAQATGAEDVRIVVAPTGKDGVMYVTMWCAGLSAEAIEKRLHEAGLHGYQCVAGPKGFRSLFIDAPQPGDGLPETPERIGGDVLSEGRLAAMEAAAVRPSGDASMRSLGDVLGVALKHRDTWADKDDDYWFYRLSQEVGELGSSLAGDHEDTPEHELRQIASIALNWLARREQAALDALTAAGLPRG